jgi:hypothetical protein
MDAYEIVSLYNQTLDLCDTLDNSGLGVYALTDGGHRTRETLRLELSQFLLYLGNANASFEDGEVALMNIVLGEEYTASTYEQLCASVDEPSPDKSLTLIGFISGDKALNNQNGTRSTQLCDLLVNLYENMGNVMVALDDNKVATLRKIKFINGMKSYIMKQIRE